VVDAFVPVIDMTVAYGGMDIITGCDFKLSIITDPPIIQISGKRNELFTLVSIKYLQLFESFILCYLIMLNKES
jgi:hypothetical protein